MSIASWISGWRRVAQAPVILVGVYALTFVMALPLAYTVRDQIESHLGRSAVAGSVADGVSYDWWTAFTAQATGLGTTFTPTIIGFASTLDATSRVLDARYPPAPLLWLLAAYLAVWAFLSGGIVDRYARQRPTRAHGFFSAAGVASFRLARLAVLAAAVYWFLFHHLHPYLFLDLVREWTRGLEVERTAFVWRLLAYSVFGLVLVVVNVVFDYARIRLVVEDRRSVVGALLAALRFVAHNPLAVASLYALNALTFLLLLAFWMLIAPGVSSANAGMWLAFATGQAYLLARLAIKLHFLASQTALFQARLAHARYAAAPAAVWPDSPDADLIQR